MVTTHVPKVPKSQGKRRRASLNQDFDSVCLRCRPGGGMGISVSTDHSRMPTNWPISRVPGLVNKTSVEIMPSEAAVQLD